MNDEATREFYSGMQYLNKQNTVLMVQAYCKSEPLLEGRSPGYALTRAIYISRCLMVYTGL